MPQSNFSNASLNKSFILRIYFFLASIEAIMSFGYLLMIPTDSKNAWFLGYSRTRILMGVGFLGLAFLFILVFAIIRLNPTGFERITKPFFILAGTKIGLLASLALNIFILISGIRLVVYALYSSDPIFGPLLTRLTPPIGFITVLSIQTLVVIPILFKFHIQFIQIPKNTLRTSLMIALVLLGLWGFISLSGIGMSPPKNSWGVGWGDPGVPLLTSQFLLAIGFGIGALILLRTIKFLQNRNAWTKHNSLFLIGLDVILVLLIWILGMVFWWKEPMSSNWFAPPPRAPNYELYPYSDAALHDLISQSILVGEGLKLGETRIVRRPFYALFLAFLHSIAGSEYIQVVRLQIVVLAIFPVFIYLLGRILHHRSSGIIAASLVIFREINAITLSERINVSHSKLLMSDMPTTLGVAVFTFLFIYWLKNPIRRKYILIIAGGVLGLTTLIRTQAIVLLLVPLLLIIVLMAREREKKLFLGSGVFLVLGAIFAIAPWLWRNWQLTNALIFDAPDQISLITRRFSPSPDDFNMRLLPGETEGEFASRVTDQTIQFFFQRPNEIIHTVISNFFHSQVSSVIVLPTSPLKDDPITFIYRVRYWFKWEGPLLPGTRFPLLANLLLIAFGLGGVWKINRYLGQIPLFVFLVYIMSNALVTISGWRFLLPVDWVVILYFSIGFIHTLYLLKTIISSSNQSISEETGEESNTIRTPQESDPSPALQTKFMLLSAIGILFIGSLLPAVERVIQPQFPLISKLETFERMNKQEIIHQLPSHVKTQVKIMLSDERTSAFWGRAFYPRYFETGEGDTSGEWPSIRSRTCNQLAFHLVGPENVSVYLPHKELVGYFPDASDVVIIGYLDNNIVEARAVIFLDKPDKSLVSSNTTPSKCPIIR